MPVHKQIYRCFCTFSANVKFPKTQISILHLTYTFMDWDFAIGENDRKDHKEVYISNNSHELVEKQSGLLLLS